MTINFKLLNIKKEIERIKKEQEQEKIKQHKINVKNMIEELKAATPVDTGLARDSWSINDTKIGFDVTNTTSYIQYLNQGSSVQAPKYFIESIALKYGKPLGTIVEIDNTREPL